MNDEGHSLFEDVVVTEEERNQYLNQYKARKDSKIDMDDDYDFLKDDKYRLIISIVFSAYCLLI